MAEYKRGSMDIAEQERTFGIFVTYVMRVAIATIAFLLLLAIING